MQAADMQEAQAIYTQIASNAQTQKGQRWQILQNTQTRIFEITQEVTANKARTADKAFGAMDGYIRR